MLYLMLLVRRDEENLVTVDSIDTAFDVSLVDFDTLLVFGDVRNVDDFTVDGIELNFGFDEDALVVNGLPLVDRVVMSVGLIEFEDIPECVALSVPSVTSPTLVIGDVGCIAGLSLFSSVLFLLLKSVDV